MNIYHISQRENTGYDTYDEAVVVAKSARDARSIDPSTRDGTWEEDDYVRAWCSSPKEVKAERIGKALGTMKRGIVCSSFHAG